MKNNVDDFCKDFKNCHKCGCRDTNNCEYMKDIENREFKLSLIIICVILIFILIYSIG